jgi:hypothetical protein
MTTAAHALYRSLSTWQSIVDLVAAGESESQLLECKAPHSPVLDKGFKSQLSTIISGFANAGGGVLLLGVSTTNKLHSGLDVLAQVEPIADCVKFAQRVDLILPTLTTPTVQCLPARVLRQSGKDTKGVAILLVPGSTGDPVRSIDDNQFYIRLGAEFAVMPYAMIKRMFAGSEAPDIAPVFDGRLVTQQPNGTWRVPLILTNASSRAGEHIDATVTVENPDACTSIVTESLRDISAVNPDKKIYATQLERVLHRGYNTVIGTLVFDMKKGIRTKRVVTLSVSIFCDGMRARKWRMRVQLAKKGFSSEEAIGRVSVLATPNESWCSWPRY